jgi:beta-glucosidase
MFFSYTGRCGADEYVLSLSYFNRRLTSSADYFMTYLGEILLSIHEDKLPIAGAFAWGMLC